MTQGDKIRRMTDEKLAEFLEDIREHGFTDVGCCTDLLCDSDACDCCILEWLQKECDTE